MKVTLRDYQADALDQTRTLIRQGLRRILLVAPTGAGKTTIAGAMIHGLLARGKHAQFWAHRKELIEQCSSRLDDMDVPHSVIKGKHPRYNPDLNVQVASIQTLKNRDHHDTDLIIVDEAHRSTSAMYIRLIKQYGPNVIVIGLTATPYRLDGQPLGWAKDPDAPDSLAANDPRRRFDFYQALIEVSDVQSLIDDGHLVMPTIFGAPSGSAPVDFSKINKSYGDYDKKQASDAMQPSILRGDLLRNWAEKCGKATGHEPIYDAGGKIAHTDCDACTVVFAPSVGDSKRIVEQFKEAGVSSAHIDGKTPDSERDKILKDLRERKLTVVSNYQILCLDSQTEILTRAGWRNIDSMRPDDMVANWWPSQIVTFTKPTSIVRRERKVGERMVCVNGKRSNIRVTEDHRIAFSKYKNGALDVNQAANLCGKQIFIPISGIAIPERFDVDHTEISELKKKRLIIQTAYNLRKYNGYKKDESHLEARRRVERKTSLRKKPPHELSKEECEFIGMWLGDGGCTKLKSGGVEFAIGQSMATPNTVDYVRNLSNSIGVDFVERTYKAEKTEHIQIRFSYPRGTGGGPQEREGLYPIEDYLNKDGSDLMWGLNVEQFYYLLYGFWVADGNHGNLENDPQSLHISNTNFKLLSLLQSIAVCRGFYASVSDPKNNGPAATKPIYSACFSVGKMVKQLVNNRLEIEKGWNQERVWCCNNDSHFLITRRRGKIAVVGNCEGWDLPHLEAVIGARLTASKSLVRQMVGRIMRPHEDKRFAYLFDHANWTFNHGFVNEPQEYSLGDREKRLRKGGENQAPVKQCPECLALLPLTDKVCPSCYYEFPPRTLEQTDEDLVELTPNNKPKIRRAPQPERQGNFDRWCKKAVDEGYKPKWPRVQYQRRYGEWPSKAVGITTPSFFWNYEKEYDKRLRMRAKAEAAADG